jgi:hypothetical protein
LTKRPHPRERRFTVGAVMAMFGIAHQTVKKTACVHRARFAPAEYRWFQVQKRDGSHLGARRCRVFTEQDIAVFCELFPVETVK